MSTLARGFLALKTSCPHGNDRPFREFEFITIGRLYKGSRQGKCTAFSIPINQEAFLINLTPLEGQMK